MQTVPGAQTAASEALRRGAAALGWRHDEIPRWMIVPRRPGRRRRAPPEHDRDVPAAGRPPPAPGCSPATASTASCSTAAGPIRAAITLPDGRAGHGRLRPTSSCAAGPSRPRRCCSAPGLRRNIGRTLAVHPTVKLAARFADDVNVPDDVPVHQVKEFAPDLSFGGSASGPGPRRRSR